MLFGEPWVASAEVFRILALVAAVHAVMLYNHSVFKARGEPSISMRLALLEAAVNVPLFLIAVHFGLAAVAAAYAARAVVLAPVCLAATRRLIGLDIGRFVRGLAAPALAASIMGAGLWALAHFAPAAWTSSLRLAASVVTGAVLYLTALRLCAPTLFRQSVSQLREALAAFAARPRAAAPAPQAPGRVQA